MYLANKARLLKCKEDNRAQKEVSPKQIIYGVSSVVKRFKTSTGNSKTIRVWSIPEFASEVEIDNIKIESSEAPF